MLKLLLILNLCILATHMKCTPKFSTALFEKKNIGSYLILDNGFDFYNRSKNINLALPRQSIMLEKNEWIENNLTQVFPRSVDSYYKKNSFILYTGIGFGVAFIIGSIKGLTTDRPHLFLGYGVYYGFYGGGAGFIAYLVDEQIRKAKYKKQRRANSNKRLW